MTNTLYPSALPMFTAKAARQAQAAFLAIGSPARPLGARSGVRPGTPASTISATSTTWTVNPVGGVMDVQTSDTAGPYAVAVDAPATGAMTSAHGTLARTDVLYLTLNDPENGSTVPTLTPGYAAGVAGTSSGVVPAKSIRLGWVNVPSAASGNAPTTTWAPQYAVAAGAPIPVYSQTERDALATYNGLQVVRLDLPGCPTETWGGTAWSVWAAYIPALTGFAVGTSGGPITEVLWRREGDLIRLRYRFTFGTNGAVAFAGGAVFTLPVAALATELHRLGQGAAERVGIEHVATPRIEGTTAIRVTLGSSPVVDVSASTPWGGPWLPGDSMHGEITYRPAA